MKTTSAPKPWGTRVQERREAFGMRQAQLADLCGLTQQTISRIERNEIIPRDTTKRLIANHLGASLDDLFPWSDFDCTISLATEKRSA